MKEVLRTNDPVKLSFAESVLNDAGIEAIRLDDNMSNVYGGSLLSIERRLMVIDEDAARATEILTAALAEAP